MKISWFLEVSSVSLLSKVIVPSEFESTYAEFSALYEPEKIFKDKKPMKMKRLFGTEILSEIYD